MGCLPIFKRFDQPETQGNPDALAPVIEIFERAIGSYGCCRLPKAWQTLGYPIWPLADLAGHTVVEDVIARSVFGGVLMHHYSV